MTTEPPRQALRVGRRLLPFVIAGMLNTASALASGDADLRTYQVRGVVEKLIPAKGEVVVRHEAIPGYMDAMTMPLRSDKSQELAGLRSGDTITFRLNVTAQDGWIDQVKVIASSPHDAQISAAPALPDLTPIQPGQPFPDAKLTDEQGREFELKSYRGNAVAITFIFTRCPYPNFCPRMSNNFAEVQAALLADTLAPKNWQLLSITIDPDHDTPAALLAYAKSHKADAAHWRFATGSLRGITTLALRCGLNFWDENGVIQHNLRTIVIDASGKVRRVFPDGEWKPAEVATELRQGANTQQ